VDANGDKIYFSRTVGNPLQNSVFENKISYFIDVKSIYKRDKFTSKIPSALFPYWMNSIHVLFKVTIRKHSI